jgi:diguanylate cyclase (GGDEF)-like protein
LTGLLDRRAIRAQISVETARARRFRGSVAVALLDLDRSAERADSDRLLRAFASFLAAVLRETDVAGRIGGTAFAAVRPAAGPPGTDAFVSRLRRNLPEGVSVSIGTACFPDECATVEQLHQKADRRLSSAKAAKAA